MNLDLIVYGFIEGLFAGFALGVFAWELFRGWERNRMWKEFEK
jgi:hypothetical protein